MAEKLLIGNFSQGLHTDREPFIISNDSFPVLQNAYIWRGRILKKGGTELLGRLRRDFSSSSSFTLSTQANGASYTKTDILADTNVMSGGSTIRSTQPGASLIPGTVNITVGAVTFVDNSLGILVGTPGTNSGTINYATGALTLSFAPALGGPTNVVIYFSYYPRIPVLGLEDFENDEINYPTLVAFDKIYSYQFNQTSKVFYDTSFYKTSHQRVVWTGQDYQQFWTSNYSGALWALNNNPGVSSSGPIWHFKLLTNTLAGAQSVLQVSATRVTVGLTAHGIPNTVTANTVYLWFNEVAGTIGAGATGTASINGKTGTVFAVVDANTLTVDFTGTTFGGGTSGTAGMAQYLTISNPQANVDGIRWYDGDPIATSTKGWVNFAPPLSAYSSTNLKPQYLIGALAVLPFKDRLLFFAPTFATSDAGNREYSQDMVVFSQNGTPYYSSLVPSSWPSDGFSADAWYEAPAGNAGDIRAGISQQIVTVTNNEDVLLVGFENRQTKLIYTQNNFTPFLFYSINSQMGSESTFSGITLDEGAYTIGTYGIIQTNQYEAKRIDLQIPDSVFEISGANHGIERVCAIRDYYNELVYWTYPTPGFNLGSDDTVNPTFPNKTLVYNYRDSTWATFIETFTTYGNFRFENSLTWDDVTWTWDEWTDSWDTGRDIARFPEIIGGNAQGYVLLKNAQNDGKSGEATSGYIFNISGTTITSYNHTLNSGDVLYISGLIVSSGSTTLLGVYTVRVLTVDTFTITPSSSPLISGTYLGGGEFIRLSNFFIQTRQFPTFWEQGRRVRIGTQKYLVDRTNDGECTIGLYLSQDSSTPFNFNPPNSGIIFNSTLFTSTTNISNPLPAQSQIWQNLQTSLIGDTVQIGFFLSADQMADSTLAIQQAPFTLHAIQMNLYPGPTLAQ